MAKYLVLIENKISKKTLSLLDTDFGFGILPLAVSIGVRLSLTYRPVVLMLRLVVSTAKASTLRDA